MKEEVIAEPKVEEEQPMSIAMVEQKPQLLAVVTAGDPVRHRLNHTESFLVKSCVARAYYSHVADRHICFHKVKAGCTIVVFSYFCRRICIDAP